MGVKVYYAEISGHKEVKKHQQRVMMILESKLIPYEAIDITEAGKESEKEFMMENAKPRGDSKVVLCPQIFNEGTYCGGYEDFDTANENDVLEDFLHTPKVERQFTPNGAHNGTGSREGSQESQVKNVDAENVSKIPEAVVAASDQSIEPVADSEVSSSTVSAGVTDPTTEHQSVPDKTEAVQIDEIADSPGIDESEDKDE